MLLRLYVAQGGDPRCHLGANLFMFDISKRKYHKSLKQGFHKHHLQSRPENNRHLCFGNIIITNTSNKCN